MFSTEEKKTVRQCHKQYCDFLRPYAQRLPVSGCGSPPSTHFGIWAHRDTAVSPNWRRTHAHFQSAPTRPALCLLLNKRKKSEAKEEPKKLILTLKEVTDGEEEEMKEREKKRSEEEDEGQMSRVVFYVLRVRSAGLWKCPPSLSSHRAGSVTPSLRRKCPVSSGLRLVRAWPRRISVLPSLPWSVGRSLASRPGSSSEWR